MTIGDFISKNTELLERSGITTARLDCIVLLGDILNKNSAQILSRPEQMILLHEQQLLDAHIRRRVAHEPLAYIREKCEFLGYTFSITPHVLVPRPESEDMFECLKTVNPSQDTLLVDVGTGSGVLAICANKAFPNNKTIATDIDQRCLDLARKNSLSLDTSIAFFQGNLIEPVSHMLNTATSIVLLCNLPYVPDGYGINKAATHEPQRALFGGPDGLALYHELFRQLENMQRKSRRIYILTESLPEQQRRLTHIAAQYNFTLQETKNFIQLFMKTAA